MLGSDMAGKTQFTERHLLNFPNDVYASARKEDQVTAGSSLLNFMNLASGNVKTALEKPANFKRNINHRRYLQKQLRNYAKRKPSELTLKKPKDVFKHKGNNQAGDKHGVSRNSSRQEGNSKKSDKGVEAVHRVKPSLRERNLPQSFWQEPVIEDRTQTYLYSFYPFHTSRAGESEDPYNPAFEAYFEGWNECVAREIPTEELSPSAESVLSVSSDEAICDDFLTGEELTQSIDIKDLYVPELYITDRSPREHIQGEGIYLAPVSPTQYVLTPTTSSDQAYFNFSFDQDPSGLPPFAMAFLSPGSQY